MSIVYFWSFSFHVCEYLYRYWMLRAELKIMEL